MPTPTLEHLELLKDCSCLLARSMVDCTGPSKMAARLAGVISRSVSLSWRGGQACFKRMQATGHGPHLVDMQAGSVTAILRQSSSRCPWQCLHSSWCAQQKPGNCSCGN